MEIEKLIEALGDLEMCAYGYHINGEVLGMDCTDFECLMADAAEEISKIPALQAENDRLQAELEKEEAARKKQADILYELRGQKYEQTTAIDQLRAENDRFRRERDAAVGDLEIIMAYGGGNSDTCQFCKNSQCYARGGTNPCLPEWRG